jgi:hypothetical protein
MEMVEIEPGFFALRTIGLINPKVTGQFERKTQC